METVRKPLTKIQFILFLIAFAIGMIGLLHLLSGLMIAGYKYIIKGIALLLISSIIFYKLEKSAKIINDKDDTRLE